MTLDLETLREGHDFEAKAAQGRDGRGKLPDNFWESLSAMANTSGGVIALGVRELDDGTLEVLGIDDKSRVETDLWNLLRNREKFSTDLLRPQDVHWETLSGKEVLIIDVPRGSRTQRPVYVGKNPLTGAFIRTFDGDRRSTEDEVRRMIADSDPEHPRDAGVLVDYGLDDLDADTIGTYRNLLRARKRDHAFLAQDDIEFLRSIRAWGRERERGGEGPTLAGLLVLGREQAIRDRLPHFHLDYRELPSEESDQASPRWADRITPDGTWNANLLRFYERVKPKLDANLKVPFHLEEPDLFRRDETRVHEALREAFVNALIHADYTLSRGVRVFRRSDRFEFVNPGTLLLPPDQIRRGGQSECRNPTLQHMFLLVGLGERAGSGFPVILWAWEEQHWRTPALEEDKELSETTLRLTMLSLLPPDALSKLEARFGSRFGRLGETERLAVATAQVEGRVTNSRLQEITNQHPRDLTALLGRLVQNGFLEPHGNRRGAWYTLPEPPEARDGSPQSSPQSSPRTPSRSSPQTLGSTSEAAISPQDVAGTKWSRSEDVEEAILALCRGRFLTTDDLVDALGRSEKTIRDNYVRRLVKEGKLALRYPEKRNHPAQAYRTVEEQPEA